jgi:hypothetical protein
MIAGETIIIALPSAHGDPSEVTYQYASRHTPRYVIAASERRITTPTSPIANAPATTPLSTFEASRCSPGGIR